LAVRLSDGRIRGGRRRKKGDDTLSNRSKGFLKRQKKKKNFFKIFEIFTDLKVVGAFPSIPSITNEPLAGSILSLAPQHDQH